VGAEECSRAEALALGMCAASLSRRHRACGLLVAMYAATQLQQDGYFLNAIDDSNKTTKLDSGQLFLWSAKALAHSLGRVHEDLPAIKDIVTAMVHPQDGLEIKNRRWHLRTYRKCFVGTMIRYGAWMAERVGHEVTYCVPNLRVGSE